MPSFSELDLLNSPLDPGLTVIEASAGTGKTYSISHLVPRLLLSGALPDVSKLLLVTFTKDAARELAERVRRVLTRLAASPTLAEAVTHSHVAALRPLLEVPAARARLDRALLDLDLLAVSTIHAFCQRTLQQSGSLCGVPVMPDVITDDDEHLEPIIKELWIATLSSDPIMAALATARRWQLGAAVKTINTVRRCHRPALEPAAASYNDLTKTIGNLCAPLAVESLFASFTALLKQVPTWNKGVADAADAVERLRSIHTGKADTLRFWESLEFAQELLGKIGAKSAAGKKIKAEVTAHGWYIAADGLVRLVERLEWAWHHQLAAAALPRLARLMSAQRLLTQDGLIGALYQALHRTSAEGSEQSARLAAHLSDRYHVALIDESQDTDPRQFAIFRRIFLDPAHPRRLILVGDPKQAIYGFRGADLSTYLAARSSADAGYTLTHTHRAPQPLVVAVNGLFQRERALHHPQMGFTPAVSALPFDRQLFVAGQPCSRLEVWVAADDHGSFNTQGRRIPALSASIASTIVDLLRTGELRTRYHDDRAPVIEPVTPRHIAVLVATNDQAEAMAAALQNRAVPAVVNSGADVFASDEARELHQLLQALLDPRRTRRMRSALATRLLGLDSVAIANLDQPDERGEQSSVVWLERFIRWQQLWTSRGLATLLAELDRSEIAVTHRLALEPLTGERRATNYRHLTDLLLEAARDEASRPAATVRWLGQQIARALDRSQVEERQLQLASDHEAVQVVTMHKAKGLEYPLVFCPYLADTLRETKGIGQLTGNSAAGVEEQRDVLVNLELLDETAKAIRSRDLMAAQLEERLRLAYVALTRAQVRAWICSYSNASAYDLGSPLDWLLRPDAELSSHPSYTRQWTEVVKAGRAARHLVALQELGARPQEASIAEESPAAITFREPPDGTDNRHARDVSDGEPLDALAPLSPPSVPASWRITSFSTLTREKHAHGVATVAPSPSQERVETPAPALAFRTVPGGAAIGTAVHDWIQTWDFGPPDAGALAAHLAVARLPAPKESDPAWVASLSELFIALRDIQLPGCGGAPLHTLCPEPHGSEWHFHLPLAGTLTVAKLARCFAEHGAEEHRSYAATLGALSDERFEGLLQGFIDRLVRCGPGWGVIDWKTNRLDDYSQGGLLRCAFEDHYLLQAHLYLVALRRYLHALGEDKPQILGAWLVFLRDIAPGDARGVLHICPPAEMLEALDALFAPATGHLV